VRVKNPAFWNCLNILFLTLGVLLYFAACENLLDKSAKKEDEIKPLAGTVNFANTAHDSSATYFDLSEWTNYGAAAEGWRIAAVEAPVVYFAVNKTAEQTLAISGTDSARVSKSVLGETLDGSTAGAEQDVFAVNAADILDGGEIRFNFTVSEPEKTERDIAVLLSMEADLSQDVGVFSVGPDGGLTRLTAANAADFANTQYAFDLSYRFAFTNALDFAKVRSLFEALKWLDRYAQSGTAEQWRTYLVRLEKNESLPNFTLAGVFKDHNSTKRVNDYVTIRIKGYQTERVITKDTFGLPDYNVNSLYGQAFINVGGGNANIELRLENNITIDALDGGNPLFPSDNVNGGYYLAHIQKYGTLTLRRGAKLTRFNSGASTSYTPVHIDAGGVFEIDGGAITDCTVGQDNAIIGLNLLEGAAPSSPVSVFRCRNGIFSGNDNNTVTAYNPSKLSFSYDDPRFAY
jgi:hypothetical protein